MNWILCGLPMSGKSTVGRNIAGKLKLPFIETDALIEEAYHSQYASKLNCRQICKEQGERFFRHIEKQQIHSLQKTEDSVISIGGGALTDRENAAILSRLGRLVYLKAHPVLLWQRTRHCGVPVYLDEDRSEEEFYLMAQQRMKVFAELCHLVIETDQQTIETITDQIIKEITRGQQFFR